MAQKIRGAAVPPLTPARPKGEPPRFVWALDRARLLTPRLARCRRVAASLSVGQGGPAAVIAPPRLRPNAKGCLQPSAFTVFFAAGRRESCVRGLLHAGFWAHTPHHQVGAEVDGLPTVPAVGSAKTTPRAGRRDISRWRPPMITPCRPSSSGRARTPAAGGRWPAGTTSEVRAHYQRSSGSGSTPLPRSSANA